MSEQDSGGHSVLQDWTDWLQQQEASLTLLRDDRTANRKVIAGRYPDWLSHRDGVPKSRSHQATARRITGLYVSIMTQNTDSSQHHTEQGETQAASEQNESAWVGEWRA